jgi:hypothetical protein
MTDSVPVPDYVTHEEFVRRFPALVLGQRTLPKRRDSVVTLLVSAMLEIDVGRPYSESTINAKLQAWVDRFGNVVGLDRVTVRRMLVDESYLHRDAFGTKYELRARSPRFGYDWSIRSLDLQELVDDLAHARADRRRANAVRADASLDERES